MAQQKQVGAAWLKSTDKGDYISLAFKAEELQGIDITQCWVNLYVNNKKSKPTHPDYSIVVSPKEPKQQAPPKPQPQPASAFPKPRNFAPQATSKGSNDSDDWNF